MLKSERYLRFDSKGRPVLAIPPEGVTFDLVMITPETAAELLEGNEGNRPLAKSIKMSIVKAMKEKDIEFDGSTIRLDPEGNLLDGQHRLVACIEAGVSFYTILVKGVASSAQDRMDQGKKRNLSDQLARRGYKSTHQLAAGISTYHKIITNNMQGTGPQANPRPSEGLEIVEEHPGLVEAHQKIKIVARKLKIPFGTMIALNYCFTQADPEDAEVFFDFLLSGEGLDERDPILVLRNRLITNMAVPYEQKLSVVRLAAYIIKAWNYYMDGTTVKEIRWQPGGSKREPFPKIFGFEGYINDVARPRRRRAT